MIGQCNTLIGRKVSLKLVLLHRRQVAICRVSTLALTDRGAVSDNSRRRRERYLLGILIHDTLAGRQRRQP